MLAFATLIPLLGAITAAAVTPDHMRLFSRQLEGIVPSTCSSTCASTLTIYTACVNKDYNTCLQVCQQSVFNEFTGCFDCIIQNTAGISSSEQSQLDAAIEDLRSTCSTSGTSVTGGLSGGAATGSSTGSLTSLASASASAAVASLTSAAEGGLTIAAPGSSSTGGAVSAAASGTSAAVGQASEAASSAASVAASATSAAASAAAPGNGAGSTISLAKGFVALAGVAAGMAIIL